MNGDTGTHSIVKMPLEEAALINLSVEMSIEPVVYYTVYNKATHDAVGDDFTLAGAMDAIIALNREDGCEDWSYYNNDNACVVDIYESLVQDHGSRKSNNKIGGQG